MSKTTYIILWTITAINIILIGYMWMKDAKASEQCFPLESGKVCIQVKK